MNDLSNLRNLRNLVQDAAKELLSLFEEYTEAAVTQAYSVVPKKSTKRVSNGQKKVKAPKLSLGPLGVEVLFANQGQEIPVDRLVALTLDAAGLPFTKANEKLAKGRIFDAVYHARNQGKVIESVAKGVYKAVRDN